MTLGGGNQTSTSFLAFRSIFFRVKAPAGGLSLFSLTKCILFSGDAVSIKVVQDIHHSSSRLQMAVTAYLLRHLMNSVPAERLMSRFLYTLEAVRHVAISLAFVASYL